MTVGAVQNRHGEKSYAFQNHTLTEGAESFKSKLEIRLAENEEETNQGADLVENVPVATEESASQKKMQEQMEMEEAFMTYQDMIAQKIEELFQKAEEGDTKTSFQIGSSSFTLEEWEKFLESFDSVEEAIKELMAEQQAQRVEKDGHAEMYHAFCDEDSSMVNLLTAESTRCFFPVNEPEMEDTVYLTWYTKEGIYCKKGGEEEYEWTLSFENSEDYDKVMEFLQQFEGYDNLRFGANEIFWQDFLSGELDTEGFLEFFQGTNNGIPNYLVTVGDSTYIDKDKVQWAKYMNSPNFFRSYTPEEMRQMQEELMAKNTAGMTKITDFGEMYKINHPDYNGERIFEEYPGGPLYTAAEIDKILYERFLKEHGKN